MMNPMRRMVLATGLAIPILWAAGHTPVSAANLTTNDARYQITAGRNVYDSQGSLNGDPFLGGAWGNAKNGSAFIRRLFGKPVIIKEIHIEEAGSDVTTAGAKILVRLRDAASGKWVNVAEYQDVAINRAFSFSNPVQTTIDAQTIRIIPMSATAIEISFKGNGWFLAADIRVYGEKP